jgi:hypothetical protein
VIAVSDETTSKVQSDTSGSSSDAPVDATAPAAPSTSAPSQPGTPTPEERLAETLSDDAAVGSDGTGMGELP